MRWIILLVSLMLAQMTVHASEPEDLYAQSAVLMDAESGRVLFSKNGEEQKAMASTTKIMTCILALENGKMDDVVVFSECSFTTQGPFRSCRRNAVLFERFVIFINAGIPQ